MGSQLETVGGNDRRITDMIDARLGGTVDGSAVDDEPYQSDGGIPFGLFDVCGIEPGQTADTAEQHGSVGGCPGGTVGEFVGL